MIYKGILFDLDGTLIDTNELILHTFDYTFEKVLQRKIPREELVSTFGKPLEDIMNAYSRELAQELLTTYRAYNQQMHDHFVTVFPTVPQTLTQLKALGLKLAIVTSKKREIAQHGLDFCQLAHYFDVFITPEDTNEHKPHPEPALKALDVLGLSAKETIMVGDSPYDIICGAQAGCKTAAVTYSVYDRPLLAAHHPDFWLDSLADILPIIT